MKLTFVVLAFLSALFSNNAAGASDRSDRADGVTSRSSLNDASAQDGRPLLAQLDRSRRETDTPQKLSNAQIFRELGLPMLGSDLLLVREGHPREHKDAYEKFFILLRLKANPALIDDPGLSVRLLYIFTPDQQAEYRARRVVFIGGQPSVGQMDWKGQDDFEREDTRQRYIRANRERILSFIPELPINAVFLRPLSMANYDRGRGEFVLSDRQDDRPFLNNLWTEAGTASSLLSSYTDGFGPVNVAFPLHLPTRLQASESAARMIVEQTRRASAKGGVFAHVRFTLDAVRPRIPSGIFVDTVYLGHSVHAGRDAGAELFKLPGGANVARAPFSGGAASAQSYLNADLAHVLAIRSDPALLSNPTFMRDALAVRRQGERLAFQEGPGSADASSWPNALPNSLLQYDANFVEDDLAKFTAWTRTRVGDIKDIVRLRGLPLQNGTVDLSRAFSALKAGRINPLPAEAGARIAGATKDALGVAPMPGSASLNVRIVMAQSAGWYGVNLRNRFENMPDARAFADFRLKRSELLDEAGQRVLLLELLPVALGVDVDGRSVGVQNLEEQAQDGGGYQYDILGVKLGMNVDEAVVKLKAAFSDYESASVEIENNANPVMPKFVQLDIGREGVVMERFLMSYHPSNRKVWVIKRSAGLPGQKMSNDPIQAGKLENAIRTKYGVEHLKNSSVKVWASSPVHRSRLKQAQGCYGMLGMYYLADNFSHDFIRDRCGEILAIQQNGDQAGYLLYDSTPIFQALQGAAAEAARAKSSAPLDGTRGRL